MTLSQGEIVSGEKKCDMRGSFLLNEEHALALLLEPQALLTSDHCLSYTCFQEDPFLKTTERI